MLIPHSLTKSYFTNIFPFYDSMLYCLVPSNGFVFFAKRLANEKSKLSKPYKRDAQQTAMLINSQSSGITFSAKSN